MAGHGDRRRLLMARKVDRGLGLQPIIHGVALGVSALLVEIVGCFADRPVPQIRVYLIVCAFGKRRVRGLLSILCRHDLWRIGRLNRIPTWRRRCHAGFGMSLFHGCTPLYPGPDVEGPAHDRTVGAPHADRPTKGRTSWGLSFLELPRLGYHDSIATAIIIGCRFGICRNRLLRIV